jgi:hypothetical protein
VDPCYKVIMNWLEKGWAWCISDDAGNLGTLLGGAVACVALVAGLRAFREWELKRARDRRSDLATRAIRTLTVAIHRLQTAVVDPAAETRVNTDGKLRYLTVGEKREFFLKSMEAASDSIHEVFRLSVEAQVHLDTEEFEALQAFAEVMKSMRLTVTDAYIKAEQDSFTEPAHKKFDLVLNGLNERLVATREYAVAILGPVAKNGRKASRSLRRKAVAKWRSSQQVRCS